MAAKNAKRYVVSFHQSSRWTRVFSDVSKALGYARAQADKLQIPARVSDHFGQVTVVEPLAVEGSPVQ